MDAGEGSNADLNAREKQGEKEGSEFKLGH